MLRKLDDSIKIITGFNEQLQFTCGEMQGWRPAMQDSHICELNNIDDGISLFAVFDGHGGSHVSKYIQQHFIQIFKSQSQCFEGDYERALEETFQILDKKLITQQGNLKLKSYNNKVQPNGKQLPHAFLTGSTANVILITKDKIYVANCGDSRSAMYITKPKYSNNTQNLSQRYVQLSIDHKPDDTSQKSRIQKAGGFVVNGRVNANLSVSRAFGDFHFKSNQKVHFKQQLIISHPQIKIFNRPTTKNGQLNFILMGCDGIWERFQNNSAGLLQIIKTDLLLGLSQQMAIKNMLNMLVSRNVIETKGKGCDNMNAIIVRFLS